MKIKVEHATKLKSKEAFERLKNYCTECLVLKFLGDEPLQVNWDAKKRKGSFQVMGVEGFLLVDEQAKATVTLEMEVPFFMTPLKGTIEKSIREHLENLERTRS